MNGTGRKGVYGISRREDDIFHCRIVRRHGDERVRTGGC
jgi:hypothetical protein